MRKFILFALPVLCSMVIFSCTLLEGPGDLGNGAQLRLPDSPFDYNNTLPDHVHPIVDNLEGDIDNHVATLGRVLFYDKKLSLNNSVACASCHFQENAFSDVTALSEGFEGGMTGRNSMPIFNNRFMGTFFWDSEVTDLEEQVVMPVKDHIEMGMEKEEQLVAKLSATDYYTDLFKNAYGDENVTIDRIKTSMATFLRSITSFDSKFDKGVATNFSNFTPLETKGMELFVNARCNSCHGLEGIHAISNIVFDGNFAEFPELIDIGFDSGEIIFDTSVVFNSDFEMMFDINANIGLENDYSDKGIGLISGNLQDNGKFKVPSIRNIAVTGPYMHDGRFATLNEVLDHYDQNIINHPNLDFRLKNHGNGYDDAAPGNPDEPVNFRFDANDKEALIAFFNTLTDEKLLTESKYSNPFN